MESFILRLKTALAKAGAGKEMLVLREVQVLDAMVVLLPSSI
jgi:hypothetical protein